MRERKQNLLAMACWQHPFGGGRLWAVRREYQTTAICTARGGAAEIRAQGDGRAEKPDLYLRRED